jgi:hypothetical protein
MVVAGDRVPRTETMQNLSANADFRAMQGKVSSSLLRGVCDQRDFFFFDWGWLGLCLVQGKDSLDGRTLREKQALIRQFKRELVAEEILQEQTAKVSLLLLPPPSHASHVAFQTTPT